ncbi:DnaD domain protein [Paraclostridium bifermentans]|uniref:DnaD domain protein n=1 Tax=Paraclostridium bifermentans TaxID=1490 RepID=UPI00359C64C2
MSLFRKVHTEFWRDPRVLEELTPEDKLFFLYLLTNPNTTQLGIYKITKKQIAFELGYSIESINILMERFENKYDFIKYNSETRELAIKMWGKYNLTRGGKPMIDCIEKEIKEVKDTSLVDYILINIEKDDIKKVLVKYLENINNNDTYDDTLPNIKQEKEKEKEEEKEKDKDIDKEKVSDYEKIYEENIGVVNQIVKDWIKDITNKIDLELFKKAIEIATDKGKCNKGYVAGIINKWVDKDIKNIKALNQHEEKVKLRGKATNEEDGQLPRKPTEKELEEIRKMLQEK